MRILKIVALTKECRMIS